MGEPTTRPEEIARLDQRDPSGARESCISPYGVYDMTGNVDEWVINEKGNEKDKPYVSGLKGGYWGPVRDRCRPMTTDHTSGTPATRSASAAAGREGRRRGGAGAAGGVHPAQAADGGAAAAADALSRRLFEAIEGA